MKAVTHARRLAPVFLVALFNAQILVDRFQIFRDLLEILRRGRLFRLDILDLGGDTFDFVITGQRLEARYQIDP